jgi:hypothetical protein
MKKLLDLLNASEELDAPEDALADWNVFVAEVVSGRADREPMGDQVENRFAVHIVDGMSKLMRE